MTPTRKRAPRTPEEEAEHAAVVAASSVRREREAREDGKAFERERCLAIVAWARQTRVVTPHEATLGWVLDVIAEEIRTGVIR